MMKNVAFTLKPFALLGLMLVLGFATSCGKDDEPAPTETIMQIIEKTEKLDSLRKYLKAYPEVTKDLGSAGNLTFFAPTNDAFIAFLQIEGMPSSIASINPEIVKNVLLYHILDKKYEYAGLTGGDTIETRAPGDKIVVNANKTLLTGAIDKEIVLIERDLKATNGVLHTIGSVLGPPSLAVLLAKHLGKTSGAILMGSDFSFLAKAITKADEYAATNSNVPSLLGILGGTADHAIFAPIDISFSAATPPVTIDRFTAQEWYGIIANHIVLSNVSGSDFMVDVTFNTASRNTLTVLSTTAPSTVTGIVLDSNGDTTPEAQVVAPGLVFSNGQVHVIAGVLVPPQPPSN